MEYNNINFIIIYNIYIIYYNNLWSRRALCTCGRCLMLQCYNVTMLQCYKMHLSLPFFTDFYRMLVFHPSSARAAAPLPLTIFDRLIA